MNMSVFYTEFDSNSGPKLVHQVPNDFHQIDYFSSFFIPKSFFCNRLLCVEIDHYLLVSHPVYIEDVKYDRNIFAFNIGVVLDLSNSTFSDEDDIIPFGKEEDSIVTKISSKVQLQQVIRKIAIKLKEFEIMTQFITKDESRKNIRYLLNIMKAKIMISDQINILFDDLNYLSIFTSQPKIRKILMDHILDYSVPVPTCSMDEMDIICPNIKRIVIEINGIDSIKRISSKTNCAIDLVKLVVQQLYYYNLVDLSDIFQFRNCYSLNSSFLSFCNNKHLKSLALKYSSKITSNSIDIIIYYSRILPGESVDEFIHRVAFPTDLLDVRRFYVFGILNKFIHRIREYPILRREGKLRHYHSSSLLSQADYNGKMNDILPLVRNNKDTDELCLILNASPRELDKIFQQQFSEDDQFIVSLSK
eukprot:NODE_280_length_11906_cov_0.405268.p2 type:complete len:418 gc:universal NODE_280_length_11906_cov_0.405268:10646-9393(-)